jgi:hypothetical protein
LKSKKVLLEPIKTCSSFVFSAFLRPGHHQFLIYIPERIIHIRSNEEPGQVLPSGGLIDKMIIPGRLFCKSIIVNLSTFNQFLTIPNEE